MRVLVNLSNYRHYITCDKNGKVIHINRTGAFKVASVCNRPIEQFTAEQFKTEVERIKGLI